MTRIFVCDKHGRGHVYEQDEEGATDHVLEVIEDGGFFVTYSMEASDKAMAELYAFAGRMLLSQAVKKGHITL